jgi:hypothetical protein
MTPQQLLGFSAFQIKTNKRAVIVGHPWPSALRQYRMIQRRRKISRELGSAQVAEFRRI